MDAADKYISILQVRFPNVTVKWNPPPHPLIAKWKIRLATVAAKLEN